MSIETLGLFPATEVASAEILSAITSNLPILQIDRPMCNVRNLVELKVLLYGLGTCHRGRCTGSLMP